MKPNNGITLIALVITIIIMLIIAGVSIFAGASSIQTVKINQFNTEMKIIHTRVNELSEEMKLEELVELGQEIPLSKYSNVYSALEGESSEGFRYFDNVDLENIGVNNIYREVIINFSTREVVDINGVDVDGTQMYRLIDWTNVAYANRNTEAPRFTLRKKVYGLNATILVENIEYEGNVSKGTVSYCTYNNGTEGKWHMVSGTEIPVSVTGTYKVKLTDAAGNIAEETVEVALANKPKLDIGMVPVVYVDAVGETEGYWKIADENGGDWYDYASDKAQWANVMLLDGLTVEGDEGESITVTSSNKMSLVGKKVTALGSMFVWIPRYMYKIPYQNFHTSNETEIGIKFLKGTTQIATDNTNEAIEDPYAESIPVPTSEYNPWIVHPAFTDGSKTNYSHSGWDKEITGIWVAKFEASSSNPSAANGGGNTTSLKVKVLPNIKSWGQLSAKNQFTVCMNMKSQNSYYGLTNKSDTHLLKASEWGAVAYLTHSKYGQEQVWKNPNSNYITGQAGSGPLVASTATTNNYNIGNGPKASTTGNVYGIYDMAGGGVDRLAAYVNNSDSKTSAQTTTFRSAERKYVDIYEADETTDTSAAHYNKIRNGDSITKWGDAVYETSSSNTGNNTWENSPSTFVGTTTFVMTRGGAYSTSAPSIFTFTTSNGGNGVTRFRPSIIVE